MWKFGHSHSLRCSNRSQWSSDNRPGPHVIIASAMAAQVMCTDQPSGTVSSTTRVITRSALAASRVTRPRTRRMGKRISAEPTTNAVASGAGNEYGPPGKCNLNSSLKRRTAVSFNCKKPSHLLIPDRQNGVARAMRSTNWVRDGWAIHSIIEFTLRTDSLIACHGLRVSGGSMASAFPTKDRGERARFEQPANVGGEIE